MSYGSAPSFNVTAASCCPQFFYRHKLHSQQHHSKPAVCTLLFSPHTVTSSAESQVGCRGPGVLNMSKLAAAKECCKLLKYPHAGKVHESRSRVKQCVPFCHGTGALDEMPQPELVCIRPSTCRRFTAFVLTGIQRREKLLLVPSCTARVACSARPDHELSRLSW